MANDQVRATTVINAPSEAIFAVLADPTTHAAIDGTGWVREALDNNERGPQQPHLGQLVRQPGRAGRRQDSTRYRPKAPLSP